MLDRLSVPRRALDFEDYVDILRRNIRWLVGPAFAGIVISTVVAFMMEDTFQSTAMIRVVPQQISDSIIRSISSQDVSDRIQSMAQQIVSRTTLTALITRYNLYKDDLKREPMEDVLTKMKAAIKITPAFPVAAITASRSIPAMQVQFSYRDRIMAMKVCADLVSQFMSTSSTDVLNNQLAANTFLNDEFEAAKRDLDAADQKLQDYRLRNTGKLPEEQQTNFASMSALEQRLNSLQDVSTRNSEKQMNYETSLHIAKDRLATVKATTGTSMVRNQKLLETERDIQDLQSKITSMKDRYTDNYPDLQAAKDRLAVLKRERDEASKATPAPTDNGPESSVSARERQDAQASVEAIESALKSAKMEEAANAREIAATNGQLRALQSRIQEAPAGEKEYTELMRDREIAKAQFEQAQAKMVLAKQSLNMERQRQGETLELLDQASTPTTPTEPKRAMIIPLGVVGGVLVGIILVAIRELRDTSLKNLKDARLYTQLSILGSIPLLENDVVVQRRKQVMWVGWATATILGLVVMAGSVAHYYLSKS